MPPRRRDGAPAAPHQDEPALTAQEIAVLKAAAAILQDKGLAGAGAGETDAGAGRADDAQAGQRPAARPRRKAATTARRRRLPADEPADREAEILKAAAEVFREKGFAATSIQDVADRVGILKGSLYYYIDNKEDLLYRIGLTVNAELTALQAAAVAPDVPPIDRIRAFIRAHLQYSMSHIAETAAFFGDFRAVSGPRRAEIVGWRDEYEAGFRALIRAGQADGSIGPKVDVRLASLSALSMMNSIHVWYQPEGRRPPRQVADALADLVLLGLAARPD